jgi:uncharacterized protein YndB with AHSA1/START domain
VLHQLFSRGPAIEVLHEEYAKQGRIDERAPVTASHQVRIDAPVATVWDLLTDVAGWPAWDRGVHRVHAEPGPIVDAEFRWSNGRARMRSRFAVVRPGHEITWTGVSMGIKAVHRNVLEADGDGTIVTSEESMAGPLLVLLMNDAKLRAQFDAWHTALKTAAEDVAARHPQVG